MTNINAGPGKNAHMVNQEFWRDFQNYSGLTTLKLLRISLNCSLEKIPLKVMNYAPAAVGKKCVTAMSIYTDSVEKHFHHLRFKFTETYFSLFTIPTLLLRNLRTIYCCSFYCVKVVRNSPLFTSL